MKLSDPFVTLWGNPRFSLAWLIHNLRSLFGSRIFLLSFRQCYLTYKPVLHEACCTDFRCHMHRDTICNHLPRTVPIFLFCFCFNTYWKVTQNQICRSQLELGIIFGNLKVSPRERIQTPHFCLLHNVHKSATNLRDNNIRNESGALLSYNCLLSCKQLRYQCFSITSFYADLFSF